MCLVPGFVLRQAGSHSQPETVTVMLSEKQFISHLSKHRWSHTQHLLFMGFVHFKADNDPSLVTVQFVQHFRDPTLFYNNCTEM